MVRSLQEGSDRINRSRHLSWPLGFSNVSFIGTDWFGPPFLTPPNESVRSRAVRHLHAGWTDWFGPLLLHRPNESVRSRALHIFTVDGPIGSVPLHCAHRMSRSDPEPCTMFRANGPNGSVPLLIASVQSVGPSFLRFFRGSSCPNFLAIISRCLDSFISIIIIWTYAYLDILIIWTLMHIWILSIWMASKTSLGPRKSTKIHLNKFG